jgi:hypothetical protein
LAVLKITTRGLFALASNWKIWIQGIKMFDHSDTLDGTLCCVGGSWMSLGTVLHADVILIVGWAVANIKRVEGESK